MWFYVALQLTMYNVENMNENGQIAYNKLDLVAECFAGLTHGFWQHENRNNH